ncbi:MAG: alkaline phosphatase family protein, partial [Phycisphaerae bacterium]
GLEGAHAEESGGSAHRLRCETLGDRLKVATSGRARVCSIGIKRRAAVLLGGKRGDLALWWDMRSGRFVTSRAYAERLPDYVEQMNRNRVADRFFGSSWKRALPIHAYDACAPDDDPAETDLAGLGRTFPHPMTGGRTRPGPAYYNAVQTSPFGNELLLDLVEQLLTRERIGRGDVCDLLCIGLSSNDFVGHVFGAESHEVLDMTVQTDRQLARLLEFLDARLGRGRYVVALTSDHGVGPASVRRLRRSDPAGTFSERDLKQYLNQAVRDALGKRESGFQPVAFVGAPWVHLDRPAIARAGRNLDDVKRICVDACRRLDWVERVFVNDELAGDVAIGADEALRLAWAAYHPDPAGELYFMHRRFWHKDDKTAQHGTPFDYDRRVPLILYGPGIRQGRFDAPADPIDVAKTLAVLIGIEPAATMSGRVLTEALSFSSP